jgi:hypothetical protein
MFSCGQCILAWAEKRAPRRLKHIAHEADPEVRTTTNKSPVVFASFPSIRSPTSVKWTYDERMQRGDADLNREEHCVDTVCFDFVNIDRLLSDSIQGSPRVNRIRSPEARLGSLFLRSGDDPLRSRAMISRFAYSKFHFARLNPASPVHRD